VGIEHLVDHLFRRSAGQMVAAVTRVIGADRLDLAEEVVQDAVVRALEVWPYQGVPDNPRGWLFRVARNLAVDRLRREANLAEKLAQLAQLTWVAEVTEGDNPFADDELAMIFMCCHPALPRESQLALTLKTVGAFSVNEIAAAFLAEPATIAQRIVRAKRLIADRGISFELPSDDEIMSRLDVVLEVIYLLFTEGYNAHDGESVVREELCGEAIRLGRLLAADVRTSSPAVHALLALMLLQASRLGTRNDGTGSLVLLAEQDRSSWDQRMIARGIRHLEQAASGDRTTTYHVQAAIAACHATSLSNEATNWQFILDLYDQLVAMTRSPVIELNRAVALARVHGPEAGIRELERLRADPLLRRYYLLPAVLAGLWLEAGRTDEAAAWYRRALDLPCNAAERRFMEQRLADCASSLSGRSAGVH
jgi:RNA polymerase sigma-70 factor (ECF subfamily)